MMARPKTDIEDRDRDERDLLILRARDRGMSCTTIASLACLSGRGAVAVICANIRAADAAYDPADYAASRGGA